MKLKKWEIVLMVFAAVIILFGGVLNHDADALSNKLVRLHVVANSDTKSDQNLKLDVRDTILELLTEKLSGIGDTEKAREIICENLDNIASAARETIIKNGYDYNVKVSLCEESFPTTEYDTFSLPAGIYTSLRIVIGSGAGHNWWCVVYPPLCTEAATDTSAIGLTNDEVSLITKDCGGAVLRFRLLEILGLLKGFARG